MVLKNVNKNYGSIIKCLNRKATDWKNRTKGDSYRKFFCFFFKENNGNNDDYNENEFSDKINIRNSKSNILTFK